MNGHSQSSKVALTLLVLFLSFASRAEQKAQLGDWDVHYIVVNTAFLSPDVANSYDIVRSKYSALVNISVLNTGSQQAQNVAVSGEAINLLGNAKTLNFRKVEEGDAIYYLSTFSFDDLETYRFNIQLQRGETTRTLKFQQKLFTE